MKRGVFLDRDGVLVKNPPRGAWTRSPGAVELLPGAAEGVARLNRNGFWTVAVSNQSGVARGVMTMDELKAVNARMEDLLEAEGAHLDLVLFCPHVDSDGCGCRKPKAGMLLTGALTLSLELKGSFMLGDSPRDILAGRAAGCTSLYVFGDSYEDEAVEALRLKPRAAFPGLPEAVEFIIGLRDAHPRH